MCSNQTLKCLLNNQSIISEAYDRSSSNQIKIFFKNYCLYRLSICHSMPFLNQVPIKQKSEKSLKFNAIKK